MHENIVLLVCRMLATTILKNHQDCMRWEDEIASTRECTHLEDAQVIMDFAEAWRKGVIHE